MKVFTSCSGKEYLEDEVIFMDVDTPGAQYLGYITKDSYLESNCIDNWVEVKEIMLH